MDQHQVTGVAVKVDALVTEYLELNILEGPLSEVAELRVGVIELLTSELPEEMLADAGPFDLFRLATAMLNVQQTFMSLKWAALPLEVRPPTRTVLEVETTFTPVRVTGPQPDGPISGPSILDMRRAGVLPK